MNHYGTLRDYRFSDKDADDIRGANVYGADDDKLGKIDDVIFDHATGDIRYVVVDTGGWLSSKKFIVPANRLQPSLKHDDDYQVSLSKQQIEAFPPYDEDAVRDRDRWNEYETRYGSGWTDGPVMHRGDAPDRIITPRPDEMPTATYSTSGARTHLGQRWNSFEDRLRTNRMHAIGSCDVCKIGPSSSTKINERDRKVS